MQATNQILITLDSCRWDTFAVATLPLLKGGTHGRCYSHATFTMAAHHALFAGKLPHSFNEAEFFDTAAAGGRRRVVRKQIWRLDNPESKRESRMAVVGRNIKDGFRRLGFTTIGTGAMNWFNPKLPASEQLTCDFDHYAYFPDPVSGDGRNLEQQIAWALDVIARAKTPYFLFINVGETHHRYWAKGHDLTADWGDAEGCARAQRASLEYVDKLIGELFGELENFFAVVCGDHGDCWGEDGLWGHGFYHPMVMQVPMTVIDRSVGLAGSIRRFWSEGRLGRKRWSGVG